MQGSDLVGETKKGWFFEKKSKKFVFKNGVFFFFEKNCFGFLPKFKKFAFKNDVIFKKFGFFKKMVGFLNF